MVFLHCIFYVLGLIFHARPEEDAEMIFDHTDQTSIVEDCSNLNIRKAIVWAKKGRKCCQNSSSCYWNGNDSPWKALPHLPDCPEELAPEFFVFTPGSSDNQTIKYSSLGFDIQMLNLTDKRQFFAIVHGYRTKNWNNNWLLTLKDLLIEMGHNVMLVKWLRGSNVKDYSRAASNTRAVGDSLKRVLDEMIVNGKTSLDQITLIGFSLGAHICGHVGSLFRGSLPRILALDPAGPLFACQNESIRLDASDAKFVQVIHTNGDSLSRGGLGTVQRMGHVDFFPNGGVMQPGCKPPTVFKMVTLQTSFKQMSCSHRVAPMILADILKKSLSRQTNTSEVCQFQTFACKNYDQWKSGRCFQKCRTTDNCPEPGLDFLFSKNGVDQSKILSHGIYFGTLKYENGTNSMESCGRQLLVTMITSSSKVKGSIDIRFYDSTFGWSSKSNFQDKNSKLKVNKPKSTVITIEWQIKNISKVEVTYTRYEGFLTKNGIRLFSLDYLSVEEVSGMRKRTMEGVDVFHKQPMIIDLL